MRMPVELKGKGILEDAVPFPAVHPRHGEVVT